MALDPNIALGVRPLELANPLAQYGQVAQIQAAQQAQQMNALKMQEYQRNVESQNALRRTPAPEGVNPEHWKIDPKEALALAKTAAETKNLGATYGHLTAQTNDLTIKALGSTFDNFTKLNPPTVAAASPEGVAAYIKNLYADPLLGAVAAKQMPLDEAIKINTEGWAKDPKAWATAHMGLTGEKLFNTLKGTRQNVNQGGTSLGQTVDAYGRVVPGSAVNTAMTATPGELLTNARAKERLAQEGQGVTYQTDAQGNLMALPSKLGTGQAPTAIPVTGEGGVPVKGKQSAFAEKSAALQKQQSRDINLAVTEIENAIKPGGLLEKSTASGAGKMADASAAFFGKATPGAIAAASLKPIADLGLKMIPRFEGPQSDKDTASYKEAAGQLANEGLPVATRKAAAETMVRIMKARKGQFANEAMAAEGIVPANAAAAGAWKDL